MFFKSAKQRKTEKVHKSYQEISDDYDVINDITSLGMHRLWKYKIAGEVKAGKFHRILDLCCGTGDMALILAKDNPGAVVTGVDFSGEMLKVAQKRRKKQELQNLVFQQGNAERLNFPDGYFDCVVISFGLRSVADCEAVLREIYRLVRPGGFVYCLERFCPEDHRAKTAYNAYHNLVIPAVSGALTGKGTQFRQVSGTGKRAFDRRGLAALMQKTGWKKVGYADQLGGVAVCHRAQKLERAAG